MEWNEVLYVVLGVVLGAIATPYAVSTWQIGSIPKRSLWASM